MSAIIGWWAWVRLPNGVEAEGRIRAAVGDRYLIEFSEPVRVTGSATSRQAEWDTWTWVTWSQIERYDASRQKWTRSGLDALGELR